MTTLPWGGPWQQARNFAVIFWACPWRPISAWKIHRALLNLQRGLNVATLITVSNSEGVVGRCDAKCHDAQLPECDCICAGMNHGCGTAIAMQNTTEHFLSERSLEAFAEAHGLNPAGLQIAAQGELFPHGNEPTTAEIKRNLRRARRQAKATA